jgi:transcriptional regulator with XRE-family HTH domain
MKYDPEKLRRLLRAYRKANNLTLAGLGAKINKSKTTVWKYENGLIDIGLETLSEMSEALNVSVRLLLDTASETRPTTARAEDANAETTYRYMYFFDGYSKKLAHSLIVATGGEEQEATMFYHLNDFDKPEGCRDFYTGNIFVSTLYTNCVFRNANNDIEMLFIVAKEPFKKLGVMKGILTGISYKMFQPISFKVLISRRRIAEDDTLLDWLKFDKESMADLRRYNCLALSEDYTDFKSQS